MVFCNPGKMLVPKFWNLLAEIKMPKIWSFGRIWSKFDYLNYLKNVPAELKEKKHKHCQKKNWQISPNFVKIKVRRKLTLGDNANRCRKKGVCVPPLGL